MHVIRCSLSSGDWEQNRKGEKQGLRGGGSKDWGSVSHVMFCPKSVCLEKKSEIIHVACREIV